MTRTEEDGIRAHVCGSCFGTWISSVAMLRRVRLDVKEMKEKEGQSKLPPLAELVDLVAEANNKKSQRCPECEKPMTKDRFQQMIPVTIDRCRHCNQIWLDTGEYNLVRRLYVEMMTSDDPQIVRLREKVGRAGAAWDARTTATEEAARSVGAGPDLTDLTISTIFNILLR
jgi:Zn-finger nucleic acid-binding protein